MESSQAKTTAFTPASFAFRSIFPIMSVGIRGFVIFPTHLLAGSHVPSATEYGIAGLLIETMAIFPLASSQLGSGPGT
ncbi:hypothetical protein BDV40DRAFT_264743 [Aspergillus tamarii]|uniref:Uncharacterized protein n=1 Tax=Aspergillus tamarii TaxID=41984 RepID=A0A5N6UVD9_ASPTM|nr:hypothetical protein BDV40DRAFT_264743 [Aspergillus tamarii]